MAAYQIKQLSFDGKRYRRGIGKMLNKQGELKPCRFVLGTDKGAAELASRKLFKLWSEIEVDVERRQRDESLSRIVGMESTFAIEPITGAYIEDPVHVLDTGPIWESHTLAMADVIRKGGSEICVHPTSPLPKTIYQSEKYDYVARIMKLRERYTVISFVPSDPILYGEQLRGMSSRVEGGLKTAEAEARRTKELTNARIRTTTGQTLHKAIQAYSRHAEKTGEGGENEPKDALSLLRVIDNMPLKDFKYDQIQQIGDYWRDRPMSRSYGSKGKPVSVETVVGRLKTAKRFIGWLHRTNKWSWDAPNEWRHALKVDRRKLQTEDERLQGAKGPDCWTYKWSSYSIWPSACVSLAG